MSFDYPSYLMGQQDGKGSGTSDYNDLENKPQINGVTLDGDLSTSDLGIECSPMTEITYAELVALRTAGELIPGMQYRITDYETIITGSYDLSIIGAQGYLHNARSAGHAFDVIVVADDESHLNENARAAQHDGDTYFAVGEPEKWSLKYCLDNDTTKYLWANSGGKGVIWWMEDEWNNKAGYDFKNIQFLRYAMSLNAANQNAVDTGLVYDASTQPNRYAGLMQLYAVLQGYMQSGSYVNPWGASGDYDFAVSYNILGAVQMPSPDATYLAAFQADWYYTFDFWNGSAHSDASRNLNSKIACRENYIESEFDPVATLALHIYNTYGLGGSVWETNSVFLSGLSSDWDKISENYLSAFNYGNTFGNSCNNNKLGNSCYGNVFGNSCYGNTFGKTCYNNTFGQNCNRNSFGDGCNDITFGAESSCNTFGAGCNKIAFGYACGNNSFGNSCHDVAFGDNGKNNTFGNYCYHNTFGTGCDGNTFGTGCDGNTFGTGCDGNTFGVNSRNNTFSHSVTYLRVGDHVTGVTVTINQVYNDSRTVKDLLNYDGSSGHATLIVKDTYNSETVLTTTDGTTWS